MQLRRVAPISHDFTLPVLLPITSPSHPASASMYRFSQPSITISHHPLYFPHVSQLRYVREVRAQD